MTHLRQYGYNPVTGRCIIGHGIFVTLSCILRQRHVMIPTDDLSDIREVLQGNTHVYASIVDRHKHMVFSICTQILHQKEEAEEAAQDVFLKAFQTLQGFRGQSKFSTWLYRIAVNTAISRTRRKKIHWLPLDEAQHSEACLPEDQALEDLLSNEERLNVAKSAVQRLPEGDRLLVTLFYHEENSAEEISIITGLSTSNVKVRLHRLRKKLFQELNERIFVIQ